MPRSETGRICTSYADLLHVSGAKGKILIEDCNFSQALDDPINIHGTFTRVEEKLDDYTLKLRYMESQRGLSCRRSGGLCNQGFIDSA